MAKSIAPDVIEVAERVRDRIARLTNHLLYVISAHEANQIVLYSDTLSSQIPKSFAANAFNRFREALICNEVVRLAACWIGDKEDDVSIPSVIADLGRVGVRQNLLDRLQRQSLRCEYDQLIDEAVVLAQTTQQNRRFKAFMNHRHKYLAHNLVRTRKEKEEAVDNMKMGDEAWLLDVTIDVVEKLYHGTSAACFAWDTARSDSRATAASLWEHCSFQIKAAAKAG